VDTYFSEYVTSNFRVKPEDGGGKIPYKYSVCLHITSHPEAFNLITDHIINLDQGGTIRIVTMLHSGQAWVEIPVGAKD